MASPLQTLVFCCTIISAITLFILILSSFSSLEFNEYGLDYSGITKEINPKPYTAGIFFLGIGHSFITFPKTVQTLEFSKERTANSAPLQSRTSDGLEVILEISFQYKLTYEGIFKLYMSYGPEYSKIFDRMAVDVLTDLATNYTAYDFFVERQKIGVAMQTSLDSHFKSNCFSNIEFFQLRSVDLPDKFEDAIQLSEVKKQDIRKAQAEKEKMVVELETLKIKSEYQKNVTINLAQGEANSILAQNKADVDSFKLLANARSDSYKKLISDLDFDAAQLIEFIKAKLVRDYNAQNLTISISGIDS